MSHRCFPVIYLWSDYFGAGYCVRDGFLFSSSGLNQGRFGYAMPMGEGSILPALKIIEEDALERGLPYSIYLAGRSRMEEVVKAFPKKFQVLSNRNSFDYIYDPTDFMALTGKKYQAKRNYINRFTSTYAGNWEYRPVDPDADAGRIMDFARFWLANHNDHVPASSSEQFELSLVERALEKYHELGLLGGLMTSGGKTIAFTFGSPGPDGMLDIMFEKADATIPGAYPMITHQFAINNFQNFAYINREEDMGIEGLRKSKMSYHPIMLTEKYTLIPEW